MILTPVYLDKEAVTTVPDSHNSLLDLYPTPLLIQLVEGDDVVLEARNGKDTSELDFLSCLAGDRHNPTTLDWNQGPIVELHGPLHRVIELRECLCSPRHVAHCANVQVPTFRSLVVAIRAEEDVGLRLMEMKAALR
jgi:hypothetical protein